MNNFTPILTGNNYSKYFMYTAQVRVKFKDDSDCWVDYNVLAKSEGEALEIVKDCVRKDFSVSEVMFARLNASSSVCISDSFCSGLTDELSKTIKERDYYKKSAEDLQEGAHPDTIYPIRRIEQLIEELKSLKDKNE